jgi:hypothetical protein
MKRIKYIILLIVILCYNLLYAYSDITRIKTIKIKLKFGINTNYLIESVDFKSGFTGFGILIEPQFTNWYSLLFSINSFNKKIKENSIRYREYEDIKKIEINLKNRIRISGNPVSLFPELGIGSHGNAGIFIVGAGAEYNIRPKICCDLTIDYQYLYSGNLLDPGGGVSTSSYIKLNLSVKYSKEIKSKVRRNK